MLDGVFAPEDAGESLSCKPSCPHWRIRRQRQRGRMRLTRLLLLHRGHSPSQSSICNQTNLLERLGSNLQTNGSQRPSDQRRRVGNASSYYHCSGASFSLLAAGKFTAHSRSQLQPCMKQLQNWPCLLAPLPHACESSWPISGGNASLSKVRRPSRPWL